MKLGKMEHDALVECARCRDAGYSAWFRPKTMQKLEAKSLVKKLVHPAFGLRWFLTDAGEETLRQAGGSR